MQRVCTSCSIVRMLFEKSLDDVIHFNIFLKVNLRYP